ncbi:MAG: ACT domain-containing protein [Bilifractor sp.]
MDVKVMDEEFSICKVSDFSETNLEKNFCFMERTDEENSLVCLTRYIPENATDVDYGWKAMRIESRLDFKEVGILAKISGILADNGICIFALSTFNTDYILVKRDRIEDACAALEKAGYHIVQ